MSSINFRAEFSLFPDNTTLGPSFTLGGFGFADVANPASFVNVSGGVKGLQFGPLGVRVTLPVATDGKVHIRAMASGEEVEINGRNAFGTVVGSESIPGDDTPRWVYLIHPGLTSIDFVGGNYEGSIIEIWYDVECSQPEISSDAELRP